MPPPAGEIIGMATELAELQRKSVIGTNNAKKYRSKSYRVGEYPGQIAASRQIV
jgi:hypothetical protein